jgi:hypothetical protein
VSRLHPFVTFGLIALTGTGVWAWKIGYPALASDGWLQLGWSQEWIDGHGTVHRMPVCRQGVPYVELRENSAETGCVLPDGSRIVMDKSQ